MWVRWVVVVAVAAALVGCSADDRTEEPGAEPSVDASTPSPPSPDGDEGDDEGDGATLEDYCYAVHIVFFVTAESTDDGVVVGWSAQGNDLDPADFVVYRRPAGAEAWDHLADVTIEAGAEQTYLDTAPAEEAGTPYEYAVTRVEPLCGGESAICADGVCDVPPSALPRQP